MNSDARYFKLGLFVIAGVGLIVGGIVVFGAASLFQDYVVVETATRDSVEGLTVGAAVKYAGVTVGKVSNIEMASWRHRQSDGDKALQLRPYIEIDMQIRREIVVAKTSAEMKRNLAEGVARGMRVRMASSGLTGPAYMEIVYVDPAENPAATLPYTPGDLYLPSARSQMAEIFSNAESLMRQLNKADVDTLITDFKRLVNDTDRSINELNSRELSAKVSSLVDELHASTRRVHQVLDDPKVTKGIDSAAAAMNDLPAITSRLRDSTARVDEILRDPKVQKTIDELSQTSASAAPAAADLRRVLRKLDVLISSQGDDLTAILANLRRVLNDGSAIVQDAKSNPSRVLFGEPPPHVTPGGAAK